jgi:hypothetical protein
MPHTPNSQVSGEAVGRARLSGDDSVLFPVPISLLQ